MSLRRRLLRKLLSPVARFSYRYGFGRDGAFWRTLARWAARWEELSGRADTPQSAVAWEEEYRAGRWDFLADLDETARFGTIAGYLKRLELDGPVLDIGCGEGLLTRFFEPSAARPYLGIDVAEAALARAPELPHAQFLHADAETFTPPSAPAAVVMNESLYYFREPIAGAERYASFLAPGGLLIISMFGSPRTAAILRALGARFPVADRVTISGRRGSWTVTVLRAPGAAPPTPPRRG